MENKHDVIIIGSGPAGLTAAIYAARARMNPLVLAGVEYGGQLMTTTLVENFPGFKDGVQGPELMQAMVEQAKNQGAEMVMKNATKVDFSDDIKKVWAGDDVYEAKTVILAMGSRARKLGIEGEDRLWAKGVSTCATCDGAFFKDKTVAVIGGGDSAMEEATFLTRFAKKVYVIHRRDEFRASQAMQERVLNNKQIEVIWNTEIREVQGEQKVEGLKLYNNKEDKESELPLDGMFLAIGHIPNTDFLEGQVELDDEKYIIKKETTQTSVKGVFVAGELIDKRYKQAVVTAGMGCMALMDAEKWLAEQE
ncbi:MAG: thioredoxin-disulfide reductase [Patescibacteria group bacterium]